ncbi:hypothetical protein [Paenibacillus sp. GYB003]|uniref:hypothetical protein n=1 Tax=Paenibacillus sp. GYB003 TaxID=2994392 RepID=UPI002F96E277
MIKTMYKKLSVLMIVILTLGLVPLVGLMQADVANAAPSPAVSCESVGQSVYVSVYNRSAGTTSCFVSGTIALPGNANDTVDITVYTGQHAIVTYGLEGASAAYMEEIAGGAGGYKLATAITLPAGEAVLDIGIVSFVSEASATYVKRSGALEYSYYGGGNYPDIIELEYPYGAEGPLLYDIFVDSGEHANDFVKLVEKNSSLWSSGRLDANGRIIFRSVPIAKDGPKFLVMSDSESSGKADTSMIGFEPEGRPIVKVVIDPEQDWPYSLDTALYRLDERLSPLLIWGNNMYFVQHDSFDPFDYKPMEIVLDVTKATEGGEENHRLTLLHYWEESYFSRYGISPDRWRTVRLVSDARLPVQPASLSDVKVYEKTYGFDPRYAYTNNEGVATFYEFSEADYSYSTAVRFGDVPKVIQTGPSENKGADTYELKVASLKRPDLADMDPNFNLKDLVWFAQNLFKEGYEFDFDQDNVVDESDLRVLVHLLAPTRMFFY